MRDAALVLAGGAAGGALRHALTQTVPDSAGSVPWTVLAINAIGSFALAVLIAGTADGPTWARPALGTGLLGGFTTFSAVSAAAVAPGTGPWQAAATLGLGLGTALVGAALGAAVGRGATRSRPVAT